MPALDLSSANTVFEVILSAAAVGALMLAGIKRIIRAQLKEIREDTKQLQHNGGSHVADYARDARDVAARLETQVSDLAELVDDAAQASRNAAQVAEGVGQRLDLHLAEADATTRLLHEHLAATHRRRRLRSE